jgi:hypothetical protein
MVCDGPPTNIQRRQAHFNWQVAVACVLDKERTFTALDLKFVRLQYSKDPPSYAESHMDSVRNWTTAHAIFVAFLIYDIKSATKCVLLRRRPDPGLPIELVATIRTFKILEIQ